MELFVLLLVIGHLIADYPLQFDWLNKEKKKGFRGIFIHSLIHLGCYFLITLLFTYIGLLKFDDKILWVMISITIIHFLIDYIKEFVMKQINSKGMLKAFVYITDQLLHLIVIINACMLIFNENYGFFHKLIQLITNPKDIEFTVITRILLSIIVVLMNTYVFGYLISIFLEPFKPTNIIEENVLETHFTPDKTDNLKVYTDFSTLNEEQHLKNFLVTEEGIKTNKKITFIKDSPVKSGMWIGILERNIILILCIINSVSSIGFLIAMKALTRFKQFEDKSFAEYYLIGSMLSIISGFLAGYIMKDIWIAR